MNLHLRPTILLHYWESKIKVEEIIQNGHTWKTQLMLMITNVVYALMNMWKERLGFSVHVVAGYMRIVSLMLNWTAVGSQKYVQYA